MVACAVDVRRRYYSHCYKKKATQANLILHPKRRTAVITDCVSNGKGKLQVIEGNIQIYKQASDHLRTPLPRKWTTFISLQFPTEMGHLSLQFHPAIRRWCSRVTRWDGGGNAAMKSGLAVREVSFPGVSSTHTYPRVCDREQAPESASCIHLSRSGTRKTFDFGFVRLSGSSGLGGLAGDGGG